MKAVQHTDPTEFWELAGPLYRADPLRHTLALTVIRGLLARPVQSGSTPPLLVTFDQDGVTVGAAYCTPPWPIGVSAVPDEAVLLLVDLVRDNDYPVFGVTGPREQADLFSDAWIAASGHTHDRAFQLRLHRLAELVPPRAVPGAARPVTEADIPVLAPWQEAFGIEAGHMTHDQDHAENLRRSLAAGNTQQLPMTPSRRTPS